MFNSMTGPLRGILFDKDGTLLDLEALWMPAAEQTIDEALAQADPQKLGTKLEESLRRKMQGTRAVSDYQMRGKLLRYGAGLGFDYDEVSDAIDRLMREREK